MSRIQSDVHEISCDTLPVRRHRHFHDNTKGSARRNCHCSASILMYALDMLRYDSLWRLVQVVLSAREFS
jgi:hypothetical protein